MRPFEATVLAAPFALALVQRWLIPSWYDASHYVAGALFVGLLVVVGALFRVALRRPDWRWPKKALTGAALLVVVAAAAVANFHASTREGIFVCGRELVDTLDCGNGGQAFEFVHVCVAGNPRTEVAVRPGRLPFMYEVRAESAAEACAALPR